MKVGDLVMFESDVPYKGQPDEYVSRGIVVAELPAETIYAAAVSILWASGEFTERVPPRILEVISDAS